MISKEELVLSIVNCKICQVSYIKGASVGDVTVLERFVGKKIPEQYRQFLLGIGLGAGEFFKGTDIFLGFIDGLQKNAIDLLAENGEIFELEEDSFVFSMHQGYEFAYFSLSAGDDPPVYQYVEGNGPPVLTWNSFSDFLRDSIAQHSRLNKSNRD